MTAALFNIWADPGEVPLNATDRALLDAFGSSGNVTVSDTAPGHLALISGQDISRAEDEMRDRITDDRAAFAGMAAAYEARMEERRQ